MTAQLVFYILGTAAVVAALLCVLQRNAVASALWLVVTMFSLAGIYVLLHAQFIAAIQVLVYAGAVMVLFVFVIMLLNIGRGGSDLGGGPVRVVALVLAGILFGEFALLAKVSPGSLAILGGAAAGAGSPLEGFSLAQAGLARADSESVGVVGAIAEPLFKTYLVPFEITSILLLAAAVGAVVLAKRRL